MPNTPASFGSALTIFYVADQDRATVFYTAVLAREPMLFVPGMTEFLLTERSSLGLMPESGIKALLGEALPDPTRAGGVPRAELYLRVTGAETFHHRALERGARELSPLEARDWGESVAYSLDLDGHVLAFAERSE